jgi:ribonuclease VapC
VIVDASALIALIHREPGWERLVGALDAAPYAAVAAPTLAEAMIVLAARDVSPTVLPALLAAADIDVLPFGTDHAYEAAAAFRRFGKGRHPAALNYGDCLAYAAAQVADAPLLFVGDDFARTDVRAALS